MSTVNEIAGTATIGATTWYLTSNSATLGGQASEGGLSVVLDLSALTITEKYTLTVLDKVISSGAQKTMYTKTIQGPVDADGLGLFPMLPVKHSWDVSLKKVTGTDRSISWSLRRL